MKRINNKMKQIIKDSSKKSLTIYVILRALVILCMIRELMNGNIQNALLCILSLILFVLPYSIEKRFKIELPDTLEIIILLFIFSAEILGEINNFYGSIPYWDTVLHTINGFLAASVGFSLVYLLNEKLDSVHLSPLFVSIVAFCFSMTIGVAWEFFEYGMDRTFQLDMQKDEYVYQIKTVTLDEKQDNNVVLLDSIVSTTMYDENNQEIVTIPGYLDIGLHDTMKDLIVNFIGAFVFSVFGYLYILNKEKYQFVTKFITTKKKIEKLEELI